MLKRTLILAAAALVLAGTLPRIASADEKLPAVIELFTSQGCSSCPPADELLGRLAASENTIALSLNVDYWDYLGWKDTLASPANAQRQRAYAKERGDRAVYTPQAVVNGLYHEVGHNASAIEDAVERARQELADDAVSVSMRGEGETLHVSASAAQQNARYREATVWLVLYSKKERVEIGRGENTGRAITYHNVAREMSPVGMWHGDAMDLSLPKKDLMGRGYDGCAVLLQAGSAGPIIGGAMLSGW